MNEREHRVVRQAALSALGWPVPLVLVIVVTPALLHLAGPARFGIVSLMMLTPVVATQLDCGLGTTAIRTLAAHLSLHRTIPRSMLAALAILHLLVAALVLTPFLLFAAGIADLFNIDDVLSSDEATMIVRATGAWYAAAIVSAWPTSLARARRRLGQVAAIQAVTPCVAWLSALAVFNVGAPLHWIAWIGAAASLLVGLAVLASNRRIVGRSTGPAIAFSPWRAEASFAFGVFGAQLAGMIAFQFDRAWLAVSATAAVVGFYSVAVSLASKLQAVLGALMQFTTAHVSSIAARDPGALADFVASTERVFQAGVLAVVVPVFWLAPHILEVWLGARFASEELVGAFRILWIAYAITAIATPVYLAATAAGHSGLTATFAWLSAVLLVATMLTLPTEAGLTGAAVAMLVALSPSPVLARVARHRMHLRAPSGYDRFGSGLVLGMAAQLALLAAAADSATSLTRLCALLVASGGLAYAVRWAARALAIQELRALRALGGLARTVLSRAA